MMFLSLIIIVMIATTVSITVELIVVVATFLTFNFIVLFSIVLSSRKAATLNKSVYIYDFHICRHVLPRATPG